MYHMVFQRDVPANGGSCIKFRARFLIEIIFSYLAELLLEAVVPVEPSEEDEERNEA